MSSFNMDTQDHSVESALRRLDLQYIFKSIFISLQDPNFEVPSGIIKLSLFLFDSDALFQSIRMGSEQSVPSWRKSLLSIPLARRIPRVAHEIVRDLLIGGAGASVALERCLKALEGMSNGFKTTGVAPLFLSRLTLNLALFNCKAVSTNNDSFSPVSGVFQYWQGPVAPKLHYLMEINRNKLKGVKCTVFDEVSAHTWLESNYPAACRLFELAPKQAFKADIFRIAYILRNSDYLYFDIDERMISPVCDWNLKAATFCYFSSNLFQSYPNNNLIFTGNNCSLSAIFEAHFNFFLEEPSPKDWYHLFGPPFYSRCFAQYVYTEGSVSDLDFFSMEQKKFFLETVADLEYKKTNSHWNVV